MKTGDTDMKDESSWSEWVGRMGENRKDVLGLAMYVWGVFRGVLLV